MVLWGYIYSEMTKKEYIRYVRCLTKGVFGHKNIKAILIENGFTKIGYGHYKTVYQHADYPQWVVKVFNGKDWWYYDHSSAGILPEELEPFWLKNIYICRRFAIQPRVNNMGGNDKEALEFFKQYFNGKHYEKYDIYQSNTRYHDGRPVLLDYTDNVGKNHPKWRWPSL